MPVSAIFQNIEAGASIDDILEWFKGVDRTQVEAVLEFVARSLDRAPGISPKEGVGANDQVVVDGIIYVRPGIAVVLQEANMVDFAGGIRRQAYVAQSVASDTAGRAQLRKKTSAVRGAPSAVAGQRALQA